MEAMNEAIRLIAHAKVLLNEIKKQDLDTIRAIDLLDEALAKLTQPKSST